MQSGKTAIPVPFRTVTTIVSAAFDTLSMTNPLGTNEEIRKLVRMALLLREKQRSRKTGR